MQKTVKTLSVAALAAAGLSGVLFVLLFALRNVVGRLFLDAPMDILQPVIPAGSLIAVLSAMLLCLFVTLSVFGKVGIWAEILLIILILLPVPAVVNFASVLQTASMGSYYGTDMLVSLSVMNQVTSAAASVAGFARMLALVVCGMSIAVKKLTPKPAFYAPWAQAPQGPQQ